MNGRALVAAAVLAAAVGPADTAAGQTAGQATAGRTAWGDPDLQGVWNFQVDTPLNRPEEFEARVELTLEEAAAREQATARTRYARDNRQAATEAGPAGLEGAGGNYNRFWTDAKRTAQQTSLVVDPPDGRVPPLTPQAERWYADVERTRQGVDMDAPTPGGFVEDLGPRGLFTRCILGFNSGPPMSPCCYNENVQIFQTPEHVVLLNEMVHSSRIVPLDGRPHLAPGIRQWLGDSRGRWEDDTLVVTTTNFTDAVYDFGRMRAGGTGLTLIERFTRTAGDALLYSFTIDDPGWYASPWTAQLPMAPTGAPLYEYACHEGNHSMTNILEGAR
ncbi:MAG: hypothetical protein OXF27_07745 [Acidobacteria bacterium]|nr:hypothetical protein [Acidobacteriota bacterium]